MARNGKQIQPDGPTHQDDGFSLGEWTPVFERTLDKLGRRNVVSRIWRRDHTVWDPDPTEVEDRLGWLTVTERMREEVPRLSDFAEEVRDDGYRHVMVLGMGGSSLGAAVLRQTFSSAAGFPQIRVLDSTVPASVRMLTDTIDPERSLFLVCSKSGTTIETLSFYKHFRHLVEEAVGQPAAGRRFVAITDPATPLSRLAHEGSFRRQFLNPTDIGGRYSVLSFFGLVPAALSGMDITTLLERADRMSQRCASGSAIGHNPGVKLGAALASLALKGRDKLTLLTGPSLAGFGLWVEQLVAESTGKGGIGIVPIAGESPHKPESYGDDRLFVYVRLEDESYQETDAAVAAIEASGHPVVRLGLRDRYDLGAEFFRWEFAIAVAGAVMGINPFDQPNVEEAKATAFCLLQGDERSESTSHAEGALTIDDVLSRATPGDYLAIMAYLPQTQAVDLALEKLRQAVTQSYGIPTMLGYGPRLLHSTGQLHKGGPHRGLFLQITAAHDEDVSISGESYTFGRLVHVQSLGDLRVLQKLGRPIASLELAGDLAAHIEWLATELQEPAE